MSFSECWGNVKVSFAGEYAPKLKNEFNRSNEPSLWDQESLINCNAIGEVDWVENDVETKL